MINVLFSRPKHDDAMEYLHYYSKELLKECERMPELNPINKEKEDSNRKVISEVIKKTNPRLIMFNGHGSPTEILGHSNETLIDESNAGLLKDSITYALACSAGAILGKTIAEKGALSFIGYKFDFAIGKDPDSEAVPGKDKIAKFFLEPSNILFSSLIKGQSAETAVLKAKKKMEEYIGFLSTTNNFPEAHHYAPYLFRNYLGLIILGNSGANIEI